MVECTHSTLVLNEDTELKIKLRSKNGLVKKTMGPIKGFLKIGRNERNPRRELKSYKRKTLYIQIG